MRTLIYLALGALLLPGCKKQTGRHCPVVDEASLIKEADLSPVRDVQPIMDSLAKYPQLKAIKAESDWYPASQVRSSRVICQVYYKGLMVFDENYAVFASNAWEPWSSGYVVPDSLVIPTEPLIGRERATEIAEERMNYLHCTMATLGVVNKGVSPARDYRLVWRVVGMEHLLPLVELDARTGEVYRTDDGIRYD